MKNIDESILKLEILDLAVDDMSGLYEIIWRLNFLYPDISEATKVSTAQPIIKALIQAGILKLYKCKWNTQYEEEISLDNSDGIISNPANWEKPDDEGNYFAFASTGHALDEYSKQYRIVHG